MKEAAGQHILSFFLEHNSNIFLARKNSWKNVLAKGNCCSSIKRVFTYFAISYQIMKINGNKPLYRQIIVLQKCFCCV